MGNITHLLCRCLPGRSFWPICLIVGHLRHPQPPCRPASGSIPWTTPRVIPRDIPCDIRRAIRRVIYRDTPRDIRRVFSPGIRPDFRRDFRRNIRPDIGPDTPRDIRPDIHPDIPADIRRDIPCLIPGPRASPSRRGRPARAAQKKWQGPAPAAGRRPGSDRYLVRGNSIGCCATEPCRPKLPEAARQGRLRDDLCSAV